jgi:choloylglycine hydrolase
MCTAISHGSYAGRNLDVDKDYGEEVIITPKNYAFTFKRHATIPTHYAIIGMGIVSDEYPLYFDAANERGLYAAGLNYLGNAKYGSSTDDKTPIAPYELIPYILSTCATVREAEYELEKIRLIDVRFKENMPVAELHFFIADKGSSIVVESDVDGLKVYKNPIGVLTNNPPFPTQLFLLNNFMNLSSEPGENRFSSSLSLERYSYGMGAIGLPGDLCSTSRFVRAAFHKANAASRENLTDIMHLLSSVSMPNGSVKLGCGYERTEYTSAIDLSRLIYSYRTYDSPLAYSVKMSGEDLEGDSLIHYELKREKEPLLINGPHKY